MTGELNGFEKLSDDTPKEFELKVIHFYSLLEFLLIKVHTDFYLKKFLYIRNIKTKQRSIITRRKVHVTSFGMVHR